MKILIRYIQPYRWLIALALLLAAINQTFSLFDPMITGKLLDLFVNHPFNFPDNTHRTGTEYLFGNTTYHGALYYLLLLIGTAMMSRIAKAFQDYFGNVIVQKFGAKLFTDGLKHSMGLPFHEFENQRSGETLSILTKVRTDCEKFIGYVINVFFGTSKADILSIEGTKKIRVVVPKDKNGKVEVVVNRTNINVNTLLISASSFSSNSTLLPFDNDKYMIFSSKPCIYEYK